MLLVLALFASQQPRLPVVPLRPGMVITRSVRIAPRVYRLAAPSSMDSALVTIRGHGITVDFGGATIQGLATEDDPDLAAGVAIRVDGGSNIRLLRPRARGYKVGILARGTRGLTIENGDLSYNYKPRLFSLVEHESLVDWQSFHHNERREWLRFGAAIYLDSVTGGAVRGTRAVQGGNGLLVNRSDSLRIEHNDFSFNSGLGIGLYRSSDNVIVYNTVEFDVRGYSHRFYRRGQDSAGLLMFEQCMHNVVAWNTVTHGGEGLFVWAGQTTMDSGTGGVNDNLFYGNDFSWAPTNGMEATFSRNAFIANRIEGSDHGLWGGYSYSSRIAWNQFIGNRVGIAIEHGQDNVIEDNAFRGDTTAVYLWANPIEPSDWGYPRHRDTRGRDYRVAHNTLSRNRVAFRIANHAGVAIDSNAWSGVDTVSVLRDTSNLRIGPNNVSTPGEMRGLMLGDVSPLLDSMRGPRMYAPTSLSRRDRSAIIVDEWGPYDWKSPKLWPVDSTHATPLRLAVLGPAGTWRVVSRAGISGLSAASGRVGDTIAVTPGTPGEWSLVLEYRGAVTVSPRGTRRAAGAPVRFSYGVFAPPMHWNIRFFTWTDSASPVAKPDSFAALLRGTPLLTREAPRLDYMWYAPPRSFQPLPQAKFAIDATTSVTLPPGTYSIRTISDDAVRVWVDGQLVIDDWTPHESAVDHAPIAAGHHEIRVQHYNADGWTELRVEVVRGLERSRGTAGPH